ncbi:hypothetical protein P9112_008240 [Eukaryota sp. TZLM1-RC]
MHVTTPELELKNKLTHLNPSSSEVSELLVQFRNNCQRSLFSSLDSAVYAPLESNLWRLGFYLPIQSLKSQYPADLVPFITASISYYSHTLLPMVLSELDTPSLSSFIPPPSLPSPNSRLGRALFYAHRFCVVLGDLERYLYLHQTSINPNSNPNLDSSLQWYLLACRVNPFMGAGFNNLAVLSLLQKDALSCLFYYTRSLSSEKVFENSRNNLTRLVGTVMEPYKGKDLTELVDSVNSMSLLIDLLFIIVGGFTSEVSGFNTKFFNDFLRNNLGVFEFTDEVVFKITLICLYCLHNNISEEFCMELFSFFMSRKQKMFSIAQYLFCLACCSNCFNAQSIIRDCRDFSTSFISNFDRLSGDKNGSSLDGTRVTGISYLSDMTQKFNLTGENFNTFDGLFSVCLELSGSQGESSSDTSSDDDLIEGFTSFFVAKT